jgi:hypothetical protein
MITEKAPKLFGSRFKNSVQQLANFTLKDIKIKLRIKDTVY